MAASELEIEPDLNKAPPHVEGELLKQNTKAFMGRKGWRKYYFIVLNDRLQYFRKMEDCKSAKEPVAFIRMSQVTEITEVIFSGVPRNHHLNCGFSLVAFHPITQQQITLNLLAETPENMRYWVHALRYIKAYWSKMKIRDTVISEEQERMLLERILSEEENDRDDDLLYGDVNLGDDTQPVSAEDSIISVQVCFADGSKAKVNLSPAETTSDLLEKDEVKENLTSSASYVWMVDNRGNDSILEPKDHPALYQSKAKKFYVLDHSQRVLVVYYNRHQNFEVVTVPSYATASDILNDRDLKVQLDISGIDNTGLFLKARDEEHMFMNLESPCDVLFELDLDGVLRRQPVGTLFARNKALGGGRRTAKLTQRIRTKRPLVKTPSNESAKALEQITEEEEAQSKALDMLLRKKTQGAATVPSSKIRDSLNLDEEWVITEAEDLERHDSNGSRESNRDSRAFEDSIVSQPQGDRSPNVKSARPRAAAIDLSKRGRGSNKQGSPKLGGDRSRLGSSPSSSPRPSPSSSPKHSRSKSPRRLPEVPPQSEKQSSPPDDSGPFRRRGASRNLGSKRGSNSPAAPSSPHRSLRGKGPTINIQSVNSHDVHVHVEEIKVHSPTTKRARSPSIRNVFENVTDSRSSSFGIATSDSPSNSLTTSSLTTAAPTTRISSRADLPPAEESSTHQATPLLAAPTASDEKRLEEMFSRTFQQEQEEMNSKNYRPRDTLSEKVKALSVAKEGGKEKREEKKEEEEDASSVVPLRPMVIDFTKLQSPIPEESSDNSQGAEPKQQPPGGSGPSRGSESSDTAASTPTTAAVRSPAPINVPSPSLLKVILLQSSEVSDSVTETKPVDFISLSGVCLMNNRGTWKIQEGCNFHDPLPLNCDDHTESFPLPGGIRAIFNHTHKRWHVLPPPTTTSVPTPSGDEGGSMIDSAEYRPPSETGSEEREVAGERLYMTKKFIVTEVGSAFHEIMVQFEKSRDLAEKKRIGSDMTNVTMGHMIRGRFCSALAAMILDGLRPYRLEGLVTDDIWKVTVAFCNEAHTSSNSSVAFPAFDRQILQPINALKTLMKDNNIRFRTFVCLSMSKGMLTAWLEALPKQKSVLRKYYLPTSFLRLVSESESFTKLYQQMLLTLEPMLHLPFDLSIDFEAKQEEETRLQVARQQQDRSRLNASPMPPARTSSPEGSPQMRPSVVIKTHAATGQRTTAGNVISAVWEKSPVHGAGGVQPELPALGEEGTDSSQQMSTVKSNVQQQLSAQNPQPASPTTQQQNQLIQQQPQQAPPPQQQQQQAPPTNQQQQQQGGQSNRTGRGSWLKKMIDDGIQQLNMGGAFTGTPSKQRVVQQPQPQPQQKLPPKSSEMRVEALYNNIGEDADELSFTCGDVMVIKEQINAEWLICELGNHTGIVPANYVKTI